MMRDRSIAGRLLKYAVRCGPQNYVVVGLVVFGPNRGRGGKNCQPAESSSRNSKADYYSNSLSVCVCVCDDVHVSGYLNKNHFGKNRLQSAVNITDVIAVVYWHF